MTKSKNLAPIFSFFGKKILLLFLGILLTNQWGHSQSANIYFQIIDTSTGRLTPARVSIVMDSLPFPLNVPSKLHIATRDNTIYTASGTGNVTLPKGKYELWFGRGMEYSVDVQQVVVEKDTSIFMTAHLKKELKTDGLVSGDMHLHTYTNSRHGDANLEERVISCVAEGLEWAVATDHNFVEDYEPYLRKVGLAGWMKTCVGNEVSTPIGHFNTYPLEFGSQPVENDLKNANVLFENIRAAAKNTFIQINHPRWVPSDYFNTKGLDIYFGTVAKAKEWSWDFDGYEVLNENYQLGWTTAPDNLQSVKRDWFNMQNRNIRATGIGNSDSHSVVSAIAGVPRNYIVNSTDVPSEIQEKEIIQNLKKQKLTVACGILPEIFVNKKHAMGETFSIANQPLQLQLKVQAASWVSCSEAELIRNGVVVKKFNLKRNGNAICLDTIIELNPSKDSWYVLIAHGDQPMFPMVGKVERPVRPLGFTNPVWIDADDDGKIKSIFEYAKNTTNSTINNSFTFLEKLKNEPEIIPYVFYHLFQNENPEALELSKLFFQNANTEHRRMLFRELAKTNLVGAQALLESFQKQKLTPLEEVALGSFAYFPIRENRVTNFKKRKNSQLDEHLSFLETKLKYIHSGAVAHHAKIGKAATKNFPTNWEKIQTNTDAFFKIPSTDSDNYFLKTTWKIRQDTTLYFYCYTEADLEIFLGKKLVKKLPSNASIKISDDQDGKIFPIQLKRGTNDLMLKILSKKEAKICFHHASEDMLIDPKLKLEEVEHLAMNSKIKYLIDYHFKYHGYGDALTDGYRGTTNFSHQLWQGWEESNAEFILDLGKVQTVREIIVGTLVNQGSWIFAPSEVEIFAGTTIENLTSIAVYQSLNHLEETSSKIQNMGGKISPQKIRYIKIVAKKIDAIPEWHPAKGKGAWIFLDEVIVR